jgi:C1A family cysteine protease
MPDNIFLKKSNFTPESFKSGFKKDDKDSRDYSFTNLVESKKTTKLVKSVSTESEKQVRGQYRKSGYYAGKTTTKTVIKKVVVEEPNYKTPSFIDHTNTMSSVKDQMNLGSCVAFAASAVKEWQEQDEHKKEVLAGKKDHRENKEYDLSEQWVYWNCKKIDPWPNEQGTSIRCAMKVLNKIGVPIESAWPYSDDPINIGEPKRWANLIARWATIGSYWRVGSLEELKVALVDSPVILGVYVFMEWFNPPGGIIDYPANPHYILGGHAICAVGFSEEKKLIKFKNSWGNWGNNGYGYLSYKYIEDFCMDAWVAKDISVTKDMLKGTVKLIK